MKKEICFINVFQRLLSLGILIFAMLFVVMNVKEYLTSHQLIFQKSEYLRYYIIFLFGLFLLSVARHVLLLVSVKKAKARG